MEKENNQLEDIKAHFRNMVADCLTKEEKKARLKKALENLQDQVLGIKEVLYEDFK